MSKLITAEKLGSCQRWDVPEVQHSVPGERASGRNLLTATQLQKVQKQAYEEAYARGYKEGVAKGQAKVVAEARRFAELISTLSEPLEKIDDAVEQELVSLVLIIARHIVRREISIDPGQVVAVMREALAALPLAARNAKVHLHPEDARLVRDTLAASEGERAWQIVEDPVMTRGGCKVVTATSHIDATVERRLASIAVSIMGGERRDDPAQS